MIKRVVTVMTVSLAAVGALGGTAGAAQGPDSKKAFPVECTEGTLAGETLTVVNSKTAFQEDGTELRLTAISFEFGDKAKDKQFGKTEGNVTCGGSETSPEGTFSFFATLIAV